MRGAAVLSLAGFAGMLLSACGDLRVIPEENAPAAAEFPVTLRGLTMTSYTEAAEPTQIIRAGRAQLFQQAQRAELEDFTLEFYTGSELVSTLEADQGVADLDDNEFVATARDRLIRIVRRDRGVYLYARSFRYNPQSDELFTEDEFTLLQRLEDGTYQEITGQEVRTNRELTRANFRGYQQRTMGQINIEEFESTLRPISQEPTS